MWEGTSGEPFPLLRIAQIRILQGKYADAQKLLERARQSDEGRLVDFGRAGVRLVSALLCTALGDEIHLRLALDLTAQVLKLCADYPRLGQQYELVAWCEASAAYLGLASRLTDETERRAHLEQSLAATRAAVAIYDSCGYVRPIECVSEEVLYRHSLALKAVGKEDEAVIYVRRAYDEMMHKHSLIPPDSDFRRSFLEDIALHREIRAAASALS
jgi:tetratricopeptide (TPR) repeat protein